MSSGAKHIYVQSAVEQENVKNARKKLQPIQSVAKDKENLTGRIPAYSAKEEVAKYDDLKHKKVAQTSNSCQTSSASELVTIDDLTTDTPSAAYWEALAGKRQQILEETLVENHRLMERVESLEEELEQARADLREAKVVIEMFKEIMEEDDDNKLNEKRAEISVAEEAHESTDEEPAKSPKDIRSP